MYKLDINYPSQNHKNYIEGIYEFCKENKFSLILKGSLAKGTATKYSDMDIVVLGNVEDSQVQEIAALYGEPIMKTLTIRPKGILGLLYQDGIAVDMDIRETIVQEDLIDSKVLLKNDDNFIISKDKIIRKQINIDETPLWYFTIRNSQRGIAKYLSNRKESAYNFLSEIKENLIKLEITNLNFNDKFEHDIQLIFKEMCKRYNVSDDIKALFNELFKEFNI